MNDHGTTDALFASYNIHKCVGSDRRFDPERIVDVIAEIDADVIALQETDRRFGARDALLDLDLIHRKTGLAPVEIRNGHNGHGWHGNLLLVREAKVTGLKQIDLPGLEPRGALVADVELQAGSVRVVAAHLGLLRQVRMIQIASLVSAAHHEVEHPIVLMGDLNEWRKQKRSALHAFTPGFGPIGIGVPSFPAKYPMLALDRILARPGHILDGVETHDTPLSRRASDHLPIKTRVRLGTAQTGESAGGEISGRASEAG